jgi:hypothetical protein
MRKRVIAWVRRMLARRRMRKALKRMKARWAEIEQMERERPDIGPQMEMAQPDEMYRRSAA